jgi:hypothetical protein
MLNIRTQINSHGETFEVERDGVVSRVKGIKTRTKGEKVIYFMPDTEVQRGEWLQAVKSGNRYYVDDTDVLVERNRPLALQAFYRTQAEYEAAQTSSAPHAPIFNIFGDTCGSVVGTQETAQVLHPTFTFGDLEQEIERRGGEDTEALKEMVREIHTTLRHQESLSRGRLSEWSELMNRHGWITGAIAQLLLVYATTGQIS